VPGASPIRAIRSSDADLGALARTRWDALDGGANVREFLSFLMASDSGAGLPDGSSLFCDGHVRGAASVAVPFLAYAATLDDASRRTAAVAALSLALAQASRDEQDELRRAIWSARRLLERGAHAPKGCAEDDDDLETARDEVEGEEEVSSEILRMLKSVREGEPHEPSLDYEEALEALAEEP
jgi:hypothetical protein